MFNIGGSEFFFILLIVVMFFGTKKLPEIARSIGKGVHEINKVKSGIQDEFTKEVKEIKDKTDITKIMMEEQRERVKKQNNEFV